MSRCARSPRLCSLRRHRSPRPTCTDRMAWHSRQSAVPKTSGGKFMRNHQWMPDRVGRSFPAVLVFVVSWALVALIAGGLVSHAKAQAEVKLEASIFSYDGKDFVRTKTTLMTEDGKSAVNTKLDHDSPAFKALIAKHSYVGEATVFGHKYDAEYAPVTGADGKVTGALFVGTAK